MFRIVRTAAGAALQGEATVYEARALKAELGAMLTEIAGPCELDLSGLEALDLAGAQLLIAVQLCREGIRLTALPERLRANMVEAGMLEALELDRRVHAEGTAI